MSKNKTHPDQKYIDGLLQNNSFIIRDIYEKFAPKVIHFIQNNNGNIDNAKDIIQEVLIVIFNQAKEKQLQLTCPFDAYFFLLCKRKWFNHLKKSDTKLVTNSNDNVFKNEEAYELVFETTINEQKSNLFNQMFLKLGDTCKNLLKACFTIKSMEDVASKLNISYAYARKKKSLCIGKLNELITNSSEFKKLKNNL